jgi:hypothetical protein
MSTTKRILGDYTIQTISGNVYINGNLLVSGAQTTVNSTNTSVSDNIITLNKGEAGSGVSLGYAGIEIDRGNLANVQIRWNESYDKWQITSDGSIFGNIATSSASGNINITGLTIYDTANTVTLYTGTVSSGKSGLYVDNTVGATQELATKSAAIAYSIIFG